MSFFQASARRMMSARALGLPVAAASLYSTQSTACDAPAEPEEMPTLIQQADEERRRAKKLKNPGSFDRLMEEGRRILNIDTTEGFKLEIQKMVTPVFIVGHTLMLGHNIPQQPANALYDLTMHVSSPQGHFLMARTGGSGVDTRFHLPGPTENCNTKLIMNLASQSQRDQFSLEEDVVGETWHAGLRLVKDAQLSFSYMQAITPNFAMGGESLFDLQQKGGVYGMGGKYSKDDWSLAGTIQHNAQMVGLQYVRHVSPGRMTVAADFMLQPMTGDAMSMLGMEVHMKQSRFQTMVDSQGRVASSLESKVIPGAVTLVLNGEVAPHANLYKFGYGIQIAL